MDSSPRSASPAAVGEDGDEAPDVESSKIMEDDPAVTAKARELVSLARTAVQDMDATVASLQTWRESRAAAAVPPARVAAPDDDFAVDSPASDCGRDSGKYDDDDDVGGGVTVQPTVTVRAAVCAASCHTTMFRF
jgi:hypothetical protein